MRDLRRRRPLGGAVLLSALLIGVAALPPPVGARSQAVKIGPGPVEFWLTVLHNNDGESQLLDAGEGLEDFGGVARFARVARNLKGQAGKGPNKGVIMVSSGDNYLAGPEFNVSLEKGAPFYDTIALDHVRYDAMAIGNHEFDFGPDVLADFIGGFSLTSPPFVSANLHMRGEPNLRALARAGRIAESTVVVKDGRRIGIVGATTPVLPFISSPRNVKIDDNVAGAVQTEVDHLTSIGVQHIVLISHLQSIEEDLDLAPLLHDVDVMVAGGGDELLANEGDLLLPGDEANVFGPYPILTQDADGEDVPVVTTSGSYRYLGRLMIGFDASGDVNAIRPLSGPVRVAGGDEPDAVKGLRPVVRQVVNPVAAELEAMANTVVGTSEVGLDGVRANVRSMETNEGNLIADSLFQSATDLAPAFGAPVPDVALQNGGGIRNDSVIGPGDVTELDVFDMVPFPNFVSVVPDIPAAQFKEILENAVSRVEFGDGRFAQISGFTMTWDANGTPQELDADGNVTTPGTRVQEVTLDDGTPIVVAGTVVPGAPALNVATIDFLARGGDQYPYRGAGFTTLGVTYQQAVESYIADTLAGQITAADYPEGGEGRITRLN